MRDSGTSRRTFLMACGRFMATLPLSSLVRPPVLYSFPSEIRIATHREQEVLLGGLGDTTGMYSVALNYQNHVWTTVRYIDYVKGVG